MLKTRFAVLTGMILSAAASRLLPHPPNFTPIAAMALFAGAHFSSRRAAFLVPFIAMLLTDMILGWHSLVPVVYGCFALIVCLGFNLRRNKSVSSIAATTLAGSVLFFVVTNLAVWAFNGLYPMTLGGLGACYVAAIPFFGGTLAGDAVYVGVLFGSFALAERTFPRLSEQPAAC